MKNIFDDNKYLEYSVENINKKAEDNPESFILEGEKRYRDELSCIARKISEKKDCRVLMLAGPSASGKTTTAHLLGEELKKYGKGSMIISMDDFFLSKHIAPIDENGKRDYETVYALDIDLLRRCMHDLVYNGECMCPSYNFNTGEREKEYKKVELPEDAIAIFEGLHALNPIFSEGLHGNGVMKMYISPHVHIIYNGDVLFTGNMLRLIRRIVRDSKFRNTTPVKTFDMWPGVVNGENKYILPFRYDSDYFLRTVHPYEFCVLSHIISDKLKGIRDDVPDKDIYDKLVEITDKFVKIDENLVPDNSLIREFIGGK